jgi:hypothetical protein
VAHVKLRAEIGCNYSDEKISKVVAKAIEPDNLGLPNGLRVSTKISGGKVVSTIELDGRIETLLATLDDLLACTQTAETML